MSDGTNAIDYAALHNAPRLLMEARLKPLQGHRFQPTGFADLGPARYTVPQRREGDADEWENVEMLLVESAQSVANRLELACCAEDRRTLIPELDGLPHVRSKQNDEVLTASYLEAHRLSSPYLLNEEWAKKLADEMNLRDNFSLNDRAIFKALFKYDPASLLHGVWLSLKQYKEQFSGGRVRVMRLLSGFIEATGVSPAEHGGTKFDKNFTRTDENADAETGYGTLPFHRTEFVAREIKAYFNLDLALLRGYGLPAEGTQLLIALSLFKIRRFLATGLRLRTACDLELDGELAVTRPSGWPVPAEDVLLNECRRLISACKSQFADPAITEVQWRQEERPVEVKLPRETAEPTIPDDLKDQLEWKKATKNKGPTLKFKKKLTPECADAAKALFTGNEDVAKAIDDALAKKSNAGTERADENADDSARRDEESDDQ